MNLTDTVRFSRTQFDYTYTVNALNNGAAASGVTANVTSSSADTIVINGNLVFGNLAAGQTVTWTNTGAQQHTVTADDTSLDSGLIDPGNTFSFEFDTPGIYTYHCTPHPWMKSTITVNG